MKHPRCSGAILLSLLMLPGCVSYGAPPEMISLGTQTFDASRDRVVKRAEICPWMLSPKMARPRAVRVDGGFGDGRLPQNS